MIVVVDCGSASWRYYLVSLWEGETDEEVSEKEFYSIVGYDRDAVPMKYDESNINRQNFYSGCSGDLVGYRIKTKKG